MIKNLILSLIAVMLSFVIIEAVLTIAKYQYTPLKMVTIKKTLNKYDWRDHHIFEDGDFVYDPYLIWRPKNNYSVFNAEGYRGRELKFCRRENAYCIFAFGDSNTLGMRGRTAPNWPGYLEGELIESGKDCLVVNAGIWGYTLFQGLRRFKEALPLKPDMALVCFGSNDAYRVVIQDKDYVADKFGIKGRIYKYKTGLFLISLRDRLFKQKNIKLIPRVSIYDYEKYLNEIVSLCAEYNIKLVLLTRPFIGGTEDELWWKNFGPQYNDVVKKVAKNKNIKLIDLYDYFKDKEEYFSDESHFTKEGDKVAAKLICEEIKVYLDKNDDRNQKVVK